MRASLTVGGIEVALKAPKGPVESVLLERYSPFLGAITAPVCDVTFVDNNKGKGQPNPPMAATTINGDQVKIEHVDFGADLDLGGTGSAHVPSDPYVIDHFFRLLMGFLAPRHDALLLHACGIITEGRAHVFAGQSGAGKSTLASLAGDRPLLSDEHVLVRRRGDAWMAASTPFWGSYAKPGTARAAPLAQLWSLRQWPTNQVRSLDRVGGLRVAFENAVLPAPDPDIKRAVFGVAAELAADVSSAELRFTPVPSIWEHVDALAVA